MSDWEQIISEAEPLARILKERLGNSDRRQQDAGFNEAQKAINYYLHHGCNEGAMKKYLETLKQQQTPRTKRSRQYHQRIHAIWQSWNTGLKGQDKARAWGWAIRLAKTD